MGRDGLCGGSGHPRILQGLEKAPWHRSGCGRRPRGTLRPEGIPNSCAGGQLCFLRGETPRQQISAKVRERDVLAPEAAAATELPSAEAATRRRRLKLTRSSRQRPPSSHTRIPWQCPLPLPSPGRGQIGEFEIWKGRRVREGEGCQRPRGGHAGHRAPFPIPTQDCLRCDPHLRWARIPGFPVGGIAQRLCEATALEASSVTGKIPRRWVPIVPAIPSECPRDRSGFPRGWLWPPRRR